MDETGTIQIMREHQNSKLITSPTCHAESCHPELVSGSFSASLDSDLRQNDRDSGSSPE